jgi:hypothetical protein
VRMTRDCINPTTHAPTASRLHSLDATLAGARLAGAIGVLVPLLAAEQDGVRLAAGRAIGCAAAPRPLL